jgi:hypothetical protein
MCLPVGRVILTKGMFSGGIQQREFLPNAWQNDHDLEEMFVNERSFGCLRTSNVWANVNLSFERLYNVRTNRIILGSTPVGV